jgi:hypothetical protein
VNLHERVLAMISIFLAASILGSANPVAKSTDLVFADKEPKGAMQPLYSVGYRCDSCGLSFHRLLDTLDRFLARNRDTIEALARKEPGPSRDQGFGFTVDAKGAVHWTFPKGHRVYRQTSSGLETWITKEAKTLNFGQNLTAEADVFVVMNLADSKKKRRPDRFQREEELFCGVGVGDCGEFPMRSSLMMPDVCNDLRVDPSFPKQRLFLGGSACLRTTERVMDALDQYRSFQGASVWKTGIVTPWWGILSMRIDFPADGQARKYQTLGASSSDLVLLDFLAEHLGTVQLTPIDSGMVHAFYRFER